MKVAGGIIVTWHILFPLPFGIVHIRLLGSCNGHGGCCGGGGLVMLMDSVTGLMVLDGML